MDLQSYATVFDGNQRDLAEAFCISQAHLSSLLSGKKRPSLDLAVRIERVTNGKVPAASWVVSEHEATLPSAASSVTENPPLQVSRSPRDA